MVAYYSIFGRQVGSHHLAIGVLGAMFGGSFLALSGGSKKAGVQTPPINASSPDEADFIKVRNFTGSSLRARRRHRNTREEKEKRTMAARAMLEQRGAL
ncbi:hypothetical protein RB597_006870 [Gaeumannomyces tritici]